MFVVEVHDAKNTVKLELTVGFIDPVGAISGDFTCGT